MQNFKYLFRIFLDLKIFETWVWHTEKIERFATFAQEPEWFTSKYSDEKILTSFIILIIFWYFYLKNSAFQDNNSLYLK